MPAALATLAALGMRLLDWYRRHATGSWLVVAILLGSLQAVCFRNSMNPDGIAYLDMGDAYLRGDWSTAIRSHWSPLYAWLLAAALWLARPPPSLEFTLVHLVNLLIYGLAFGTFTFLLREILATMCERGVAAPAEIRLPEWAWLAVGYAIFIWCTTLYMPLWLVTPDLLVSAIVYAICGLTLRLCRLPRWRTSALLGSLLGLGYLAKAPMLPLGVVFLAAGMLVLYGRARRVWHCIVASAALAVVAVPFVVVLSVANGHPTVGDSASLNYLWRIDRLPLVHWQGGPAEIGQPLHPSQLVLERPAIFAFQSPFPVTYAPWYAPEYWFAGARPAFTPSGQVQAILAALQVYAGLALDLGGVLAAIAILVSMRSRPWRVQIGASLALLAPALAAIGMYALVLVEARYLAPFLVLLVLGLLMLVRLPRAEWSTALVGRVAVVLLGVVLLQMGWTTASLGRSMLSQVRAGSLFAPDTQAQVAEALHAAGIGPGDPVASGTRAFNEYWARLARVRIVAEVSDREAAAILDADPAARAAAQQVLVAQDVRAVVARAWPAETGDPGWQSVEGTDYFYYLVPNRSSP